MLTNTFLLVLVPSKKCYITLSFLLQVWYAASYAEFVNQKIHDISEEERKGNKLFCFLRFWYNGAWVLDFWLSSSGPICCWKEVCFCATAVD